MAEGSFEIEPIAPFRLDLTAWALRRRADNIVDRWDGMVYRRALPTAGGAAVEIEVRQLGPADAPRLEVAVVGSEGPPSVPPSHSLRSSGHYGSPVASGLSGGERDHKGGAAVQPVSDALARLLGTGIDLSGFYRMAAGDPMLGPLAARFRGLKPPRYPTLFECLANAIACQQVTLTLGIRILNRLVERLGPAATSSGDAQGPAGPARAFPRPEDVAAADPDELRGLGLSGQKARALIGVAHTILDTGLSFDTLASLDDEEAVARLRELRGVGRWTAEYVLLRGLGRLNVFPGDDIGARKRLGTWLDVAGPLDYAAVAGLLERWQPYSGLLYFHLLLDRLAGEGLVHER